MGRKEAVGSKRFWVLKRHVDCRREWRTLVVALVFGRHSSPTSRICPSAGALGTFQRCCGVQAPEHSACPSARPSHLLLNRGRLHGMTGPQMCAKIPRDKRQNISSAVPACLLLAHFAWKLVVDSVWCGFSKAHKVNICIRPTLPSPFIAAIVCLSRGSDSVLP